MKKSASLGIRPQDILLLLKLIASEGRKLRQLDLAMELGLSQAEIAYALGRLKNAGLVDESKKRVQKLAVIELVSHALKYFYPAEFGSFARGVPTGHSARPMVGKLMVEENLDWVWPSPEGERRGIALVPIYETVPSAAKNDPELYELLALVDSIRAGSVRERKIAEEEFRKRVLRRKNSEQYEAAP
jgi:hypothetical protein